MGLRFRILAALYIVAVLYATDSSINAMSGMTGILGALAGLLVLCVLALWPNPSRADRVDQSLDGASWADRIDIDSLARQQKRRED